MVYALAAQEEIGSFSLERNAATDGRRTGGPSPGAANYIRVPLVCVLSRAGLPDRLRSYHRNSVFRTDCARSCRWSDSLQRREFPPRSDDITPAARVYLSLESSPAGPPPKL